MAGAAVGDVLVLGALLAVLAVDLVAGAGVALAAVSVLIRWGTSSLDALAGNQAVVGAAGWSGPAAAAASAWFAAGAMIAASPGGLLPAAAFGLAAANVVAGPALGGDVAVRLAASVLGVIAAWAVGRLHTPPWTGRAALTAGVVAVALAAVR